MLKRTLTILLLFCGLAFSQNIDSLLNIIESRQNDDEWMEILSGNKNYHLLYFQVEHENNTYFAGRDIGLDQYNLSAQATYSFKNLSLSGAAIIYESLYPPLQVAALSAAYRLPLKLPFDISLSYDRSFFFNKNDTLISLYPNSINASVSYSKKFFSADFYMSLIAGSENLAFQMEPSIEGDFEIFKWKNSNSISIRPKAIFLLGTESVAFVRVPQRQFLLSSGSPNGNGSGNGQGQGQGNNPDPIYMNSFGLLNTAIELEILAQLGDLELGLTYQNNRPKSMDPDISYSQTSVMAISMGYVFAFTTE